MTLEKQYKRYLRENPIGFMEYREWLEDLAKQIGKAIETADKRENGELKQSIRDTLYQVVNQLGKRMDGAEYYGDISDLGNEIGYAVGNVVKNMNEQETIDFIHGIKHGISLTNGTH